MAGVIGEKTLGPTLRFVTGTSNAGPYLAAGSPGSVRARSSAADLRKTELMKTTRPSESPAEILRELSSSEGILSAWESPEASENAVSRPGLWIRTNPNLSRNFPGIQSDLSSRKNRWQNCCCARART